MPEVLRWLIDNILEKVSHCLLFFCAWTAWVFSVISLGSYNWIAENVNSINGPYTYGLFMERDTCSLCQPVQNVTPFLNATRAFMILGCLFGFPACVIDVVIVVKSKRRDILPRDERQKLLELVKRLKIACLTLLCLSGAFTLIGVSIFQANGIQLIENNGVEGSLLQPYGYGLVLAWCTFVLYIFSIPFAALECSRDDEENPRSVTPANSASGTNPPPHNTREIRYETTNT